MTARAHPTFCIVNHSTVVSDDDVARYCLAQQTQATYHFQPHWNAGATLLQVKDTPAGRIEPGGVLMPSDRVSRDAAIHVASAIPAGAWLLVIADDSDQAGALGYHEIDVLDVPIGYVFAKTDQHYGLSWTVTASHELLEMLGDPYANTQVQVKQDGTALAYETADAVEADELGYLVHGVLLSDFVFPQWFTPGSPGPWDFRGHCTAPLEIRPGGYMAVWRPGKGWTQVAAATPDAHGLAQPRHIAGPRFRMRREGRGLAANSRHVADLPDWLE